MPSREEVLKRQIEDSEPVKITEEGEIVPEGSPKKGVKVKEKTFYRKR